MILVDTSIWVDHLRSGNATLVELLNGADVLAHPWVTGELALGGLRHRADVIRLLSGLPQALVATADEVLSLIDTESLHSAGIGYVDAQLLAATRITSGSALWTADKRLAATAARLGVAHRP
jgi:predicted nucleic acid-binding protein